MTICGCNNGKMDKEKLEELEHERKRLAQGGGQAQVKKQHSRGKLTAWERLERLFDAGKFVELNLWAKPLRTGFDIDEKELPRDALLTGYGEVNGRIVYAACSDYTVAGGSQGAMQLMKLGRVMQQARDEGVPYVGIIDSTGRRIQDVFGRWGFRAPIRLPGCEEGALDMFSPPMSSGVIPQISLMLGPCYAGTAYSPVMADFVIFRKGISFMSVASPSLLKAVTFADVTQEEIGGAWLHATTTGSCDILVETDEEALEKCRELLGFLPSNWRDTPQIIDTKDPANRREERLLQLVPSDPSQSYDIHDIITLLTDNHYFFELQSLYAKNMVTGFARFGGQVIGIVANNPIEKEGSLDANACDKAARFIRTCDAFNIPLIFLIDTPGFLPSVEQEQSPEGLERHAAKPIFAICEATVPMISIYVGKCYGAGRLVMGTREMGIDAAFAWPTAQIRPMDLKSLAKHIFQDEIVKSKDSEKLILRRAQWLEQEFREPYWSAGMMAVDDIINPRQTREVIVNTLGRLSGKQQPVRPWRKHALIPM